MKVIRPYQTLLFLAAVAVACACIAMVFPSDGLQIAGHTFRFKSWDEQPDSAAIPAVTDIDAHLAMLDSTATASADTSRTIQRTETIASLQFAEANSASFFPFFEALKGASSGNKVHVFHYGDSQIEGDRMTNIVRDKLQARFGGSGCGLICPLPVAPPSSVILTQSSNWKRYTSYGYDDGKCGHQNYGPMCAFTRFTPVKAAADSSGTTEAYIEFRPSSMATASCKQFQEAVLFFGNSTHPCQLTVLADDVPVATETLPITSSIASRSFTVPQTNRIRFVFEAVSSPDIYGISLNSMSGVGMSNIALRGNDGSAFYRVNSGSMQPAFKELQAGLFILQFGGNSVPYLSGRESARKHGASFRTHIQRFKSMHPGAAVIVIGPSDMSTSVNGVMQTWPYLEELNQGMKEAAFAEGCAFWDMFSVMGGRNSMIAWVNHNPQYAGPDYTHFTPSGARKMAELLAKAILDEYDAWGAGTGD
jgi:lysophospholipase L1-like esterase